MMSYIDPTSHTGQAAPGLKLALRSPTCGYRVFRVRRWLGGRPRAANSGIKTTAARVGKFLGALLLTGACTLTWAQHGVPSVKLATLEWPPYTGQNLPHGGVSTQLVRAAFDAVGYHLQPGFYPWTRAISATTYREGYVGYYPEYASAQTRKACLLAGPIGSSRLGFAHKTGHRPTWTSVRDLSRYRIGVVRDYINSEQLDAAIASGAQEADEARDDAQNLRKLIAGRIDLAVIDAAVMAYLMSEDPLLRPHRGELSFGERWLETKDLYICFRHDRAGRHARDLFHAGVSRIGVLRPTP